MFIVNEKLGIALVGTPQKNVDIFQQVTFDGVRIEPELVVYTVPNLEGEIVEAELALTSTWGLKATNVINSTLTGRGVKVAILDTGFETNHPNFLGRNIVSQPFIPGVDSAHDDGGHGSHCIGTACGNIDSSGIKYGVAHESSIYVGKVLKNGSGAQAWIINGIDWAVSQGCKVISMSLGSPVHAGLGFNSAYERSAADALSKGSIVIAAAGNDSDRRNKHFAPVSSPANCPSILAVGALDSNLQIANFSNRSINPQQLVDISAPGVSVHSSWLMPTRYKNISGTSMATPHVAGVLALIWEKFPNRPPSNIINNLFKLAKVLPHSSADVGAGLLQAP